jgi:hypothetical protein
MFYTNTRSPVKPGLRGRRAAGGAHALASAEVILAPNRLEAAPAPAAGFDSAPRAEEGEQRHLLVLSFASSLRSSTAAVSDLATDPELGRSFRERIVSFRVSEVRRVIDRAIARGELRPDVDVDLVHEMLFGPVYYRLLLSGGPLDDGLATRIVDALMPAIRAEAQ